MLEDWVNAVHLQRAGEDGIETGDGGTTAQSGIDQAARAGAGSAQSGAGAAGARTDRSAETARAAAGSVGAPRRC